MATGCRAPPAQTRTSQRGVDGPRRAGALLCVGHLRGVRGHKSCAGRHRGAAVNMRTRRGHMSSELELSFLYKGGSEVDELPVMVDVVDANLEAVAKPRSVQLARGWRQDLEPGTYLARVRFPSGEILRQTCTVREGEHARISIDVHGLSRHDRLERSAVLRPL